MTTQSFLGHLYQISRLIYDIGQPLVDCILAENY